MKGRILKNIVLGLIYLALWQLISMAVGKEILFPSPLATVKALWALFSTAEFYRSVGLTLLRVMGGYAAGIVTGSLLGILTAFSKTADWLLSPLRTIIKATPVTSFIILVILWLTSSLAPAFIAFLMVAPIAWANVRQGILSTDAQLIEMAKLYRVSPVKMLLKLYLPSAFPQFMTACTTGLGFAWKSGVAAEVIAGADFSIGDSLYESKLYLEIPELFAWTAVVILLSLSIERLIVYILRRYSHDKV